MKKHTCPRCEKELINLSEYDKNVDTFWCDDCNIEIIVEKQKHMTDVEAMKNGYEAIKERKRMLKQRLIEFSSYMEFCTGYLVCLLSVELITSSEYEALWDFMMDDVLNERIDAINKR